MENASKALTLAGGILIALLILSLLVFGFNKISVYKKQQEIEKSTAQLLEYNKKFESYNKGVVKGYELVSLSNLIIDTNSKYPESEGYTRVRAYIKIKDQTSLNICGLENANNSKKYLNKDIDLSDYMTGQEKNSADTNIYGMYKKLSNNGKGFKDLYFQCDNIEYNENNRTVTKMYFSQILKQ